MDSKFLFSAEVSTVYTVAELPELRSAFCVLRPALSDVPKEVAHSSQTRIVGEVYGQFLHAAEKEARGKGMQTWCQTKEPRRKIQNLPASNNSGYVQSLLSFQCMSKFLLE